MIRFFVLLLLWVTSMVFAQNSSEQFKKANSFYTEAKYNQAIESYKNIISSDEHSSEIYYNLANCYYKLGEVAPAIFNYEKALQLNPLNADAKNNLIFARRLTLDRIEPLPKTFSDNLNSFFGKLSFETWGILAIIFSVLGSSLFLGFYLSDVSSRKKVFFTTSVVSFLLLITTLTIAFQQFNKVKSTKYAIVFSKKVSVKNEPTKRADETFILHEGTKVKILDRVDSWKKIKLSDGKIGWLKSNSIKEI